MERTPEEIKWSPALETGIPTLDTARREFVGLYNRLVRLLRESKCEEEISSLFFSLIHYAGDDLIREEMLLRDAEYPRFSVHREAHGRFIEQIRDLQERYASGDDHACWDLFTFLQEWFNDHILNYDREALDHLHARGKGGS